jgi:hypothetical protein
MAFQESYYSSGLLAATDYSKGGEVGKATNTGSSQTVTPSVSDFICDVTISARRVLDVYQLTYFERYYVSGEIVVIPTDDPDMVDGDRFLEAHLARYADDRREWIASLDYSMRLALGKRFIDAEMYPVRSYLEPVDVRRKKAGKTKWSHLYGN